jgi:uncharacterized protein YbjT (DUF2867 family)
MGHNDPIAQQAVAQKMGRTAVLAGASGMTGGCVLERLLHDEEYTRVITLVRRNSLVRHRKTDERIISFDELGMLHFERGADVFCALGTTIKKAGSQAEFRKVDFEYPVSLAQRAHDLGAASFSVVSSVGADPSSSNFYLKTKGEMELAIQALPFRAVHIFRPSFLMGLRREWRPGEAVGGAIANRLRLLLLGPMRKYRPIEGDAVAAAMIAAALGPSAGVTIHHYDEIRELAKSMRARRAAEA